MTYTMEPWDVNETIDAEAADRLRQKQPPTGPRRFRPVGQLRRATDADRERVGWHVTYVEDENPAGGGQ